MTSLEGGIGRRRGISKPRRFLRRIRTVDAVGAFAVLLAGVLLAAPVAWGQEKVQARVGNHQGYDRAVFDWAKPIGYDVQIADRAVRVVFEQASELDIATMARKFGAAATDLKAAREGNRAVVSFTLPPRVQLRHFRNDNSIVLDFVRAGASAPAVDPASTRQLAQERGARPSGAGPAAAEPAQIVPPPPPSAAASPAASSAASTAPAPAAMPRTVPWPGPEAPPASAAATTDPATPTGAAAPATPPQPPAAAASPTRATAAPAAPVATPPTTLAPPAAASAPPSTSTSTAAVPARAAGPTPLTPRPGAGAAPSPVAGPVSAPGPGPLAGSGPAPVPPVAETPPAVQTPAGGRAAVEAEKSLPTLTMAPLPTFPANAEPLVVEVVPSAAGYRLRFPTRDAPPLAAFMRDGVVWVVFERRLALDLSQVQARQRELGRVDVSMAEIPVPATTLRLAPPTRMNVGVLREGEAWVVEVGALPTTSQRAYEPTIRGHPDGSGGRVGVDMPGVRNVMRLKDPETNDDLIVVPTTTAGAAVIAPRPYPEFRILGAGQGIVVQPFSDLVRVKVLGDGVEIAGASPIPVLNAPQASTSVVNSKQKLLDIDSWIGDGRRFDERRQAMHRAITEAPQQRRGSERLKLIQLLFAGGYAVEALTQLRTLETEAPRLAQSTVVRMLRGATAVMADDIEDADRSLAQPALALSNEAALWRGIVRLRQGVHDEASELTLRGLDFAQDYPRPLGPKVLLAVAQAQVAAGRNDDAAHVLSMVPRDRLVEGDRLLLTFLRGKILELRGDTAGALATWLTLEQGPPSPARAEAILARLEILTATKQIERGEAIDRLERLRLTWRGDRIEMRTLLMLARMHSANSNHRAGLKVLRDAAALFPTAREAREIGDEMNLLFAKLFLDGDADKLPPIQAIALFEEFRDLVPISARGDAMVRNLADRLVQVDLMERAAALLEHQLKHRASAGERASLGARLATIQLIEASPEAALQTLAASDEPGTPDALKAERRLLEARALADLGRGSEGLQRVAEDVGVDADLLRAEILRKARDWRGVAAALARVVGEPPAGAEKLADDRALALIHRATALALAGDDAALADLRRRYAAAMEGSRYAGLFRVVAAAPIDIGSDASIVAQQVAAAAPFQSFLQVYRDRLGKAADKGS